MKISDVFGAGEISNYKEIVCKVGEEDICFLEDEIKAEAVAFAINNHDSLVAFIRKVAGQQDGTLLGNEASQVLAGMGEL